MKKIIYVLGALLVTPSYASILVEPVAGYSHLQRFDLDGIQEFKTASGYSYGGRLGWEFTNKWQVGVDYLRSTYDFKSDDVDKDLESSEWGGFVGYKFDAPWRVYGGYIFSVDAETELSKQSADFEGYGIKAGVGWVIRPWLNLNFEYRRVTLDERDIAGVDSDQKGYLDSYMLALSFPFTFF